MEAELQGEQVTPELRPEEQEALDRYRESQKSEAERSEGMPEGYNEDGTKKEELIGGKFKSQDDLLTAYQELEKKLGAPSNEETPKVPEGSDDNTQEGNEEPKGLGLEKFSQEYAENGSLSEASYEELQKLGFSKREVDVYIEGQKAYAGQFNSTIYNIAGGEQEYTQVITWAAENVDADVINDYNQALKELDVNKASRHLEYIKMKMDQSVPRETRRLEGDSGGVGLQPFSDKNEWQRAQTNRLYGKDAKYTKMVDQRYLASRKRGIL